MRISCPHCFTTNDVPGERLAQGPKCGKCKSPLFAGKPVPLGESNFDKLVANTEVPVIVDCWAEWCGPCKMFAPVFEQAAGQLEPRFRLAKVNTEHAQALAGRLQIRSIPTLIVFKNGKEITRHSGAMPLGQFVQWANQFG